MKTFNCTVMVVLSVVLAAAVGCGAPESAPTVPTPAGLGASGKPFPSFPVRYRGAGRFQDVSDPRNRLVARYTFDMALGVNREEAAFVDREILIFNVYDLDPSDGTDPDREYFIQEDPATGKRECTLNPNPLPNVFSRTWWLGNGMVYQGTETIGGFLADCWQGTVAGAGLEARFCNRADRYPDLAPVLKKLGPFEFYDHFGTALDEKEAPPPSFFKLPRICRGL